MSSNVWFRHDIERIAVALAQTATAHPDSTWVEGYHAGIAALLTALGSNGVALPAPTQPRVIQADWYELPDTRFDDTADLRPWRQR